MKTKLCRFRFLVDINCEFYSRKSTFIIYFTKPNFSRNNNSNLGARESSRNVFRELRGSLELVSILPSVVLTQFLSEVIKIERPSLLSARNGLSEKKLSHSQKSGVKELISRRKISFQCVSIPKVSKKSIGFLYLMPKKYPNIILFKSSRFLIL